MTTCTHTQQMLITAGRGNGDQHSVHVCRDCGEIDVRATKEGVRFELKFHLWSTAAVIAASQSIAKSELTPAERHKRVWKPLDLAHLRLYAVKVRRELKGGKHWTDHHVVAADAPNCGHPGASKLIEDIYREAYDNDPNIVSWSAYGEPLQVLQPLDWTENGISLINEELASAVRRYLAVDNEEDAMAAREEMARLVKERDGES